MEKIFGQLTSAPLNETGPVRLCILVIHSEPQLTVTVGLTNTILDMQSNFTTSDWIFINQGNINGYRYVYHGFCLQSRDYLSE